MQCRKIRRAGKYDPESICFNCSGELQKKSPLFDRGQSTQSGRILQRIVQHNTNKNWAKDFHKRIWRPSGGVQTLINTEQWPHLRGCSVCSPVYVCLFFWFRVWFSNKTAHKWDAQMDGHLSDFDTVWLINVAHGRRSEKQPVFFFIAIKKQSADPYADNNQPNALVDSGVETQPVNFGNANRSWWSVCLSLCLLTTFSTHHLLDPLFSLFILLPGKKHRSEYFCIFIHLFSHLQYSYSKDKDFWNLSSHIIKHITASSDAIRCGWASVWWY